MEKETTRGLTHEQRKFVREKYQQGWNDKMLSDALGANRSSIKYYRHQVGLTDASNIKKGVRRPVAPGMDEKKAGRRYMMNEEDIKQLNDLYWNHEMTDREIAWKMGFSEQYVQRMRIRNGIVRR